MGKPLYTDNEWSFEAIDKVWDKLEQIAKEKYDLTYFPPIFEVIPYERMLNVYATAGLPNMYHHWSHGKAFVQHEKSYMKGLENLAYEVVINTNPSMCYLMDSNSMTMQTLVMAHAAVGHSSFFKHNKLFQEHTDPDNILGFLEYAKEYIKQCEFKYGEDAVEDILDCCHTLRWYSIDRYKKPKLSRKKRIKKIMKKQQEEQDAFNHDHFQISSTKKEWTKKLKEARQTKKEEDRKIFKREENILRYIKDHSETLQGWEREILNIVCKINQYLYPQMHTQVMNEGWACFWHYHLMHDLEAEGCLPEGAMFEFLASHTGVVFQPAYNKPYYSGINPYALGFNIMMDIKRICQEPTAEDKEWFPDIAGTDWLKTMKEIIQLHRDDSFIQTFLSPKVIRDMGLFNVLDDIEEEEYIITDIHDDEGYQNVRQKLSEMYTFSNNIPDIYVRGHDLEGFRELSLVHKERQYRGLQGKSGKAVLQYVRRLWGFPVHLDIHYTDRHKPVKGICAP